MVVPATSVLCSVFILYFAGSPIFYSPSPRGNCSSCCEIHEKEDIQFLLYTNKNPQSQQYLVLDDEHALSESNFNAKNPLVIYLHGFSESATGANQSSQQLKDAFLQSGNYNVILVDWSPIAALPWYANAVDKVPVTARYVARFLNFLIDSGLSIKNIHLIGFSLGAEVAGFIGKQLQEWGVKLNRLTGLDPAFPLFENVSPSNRLAHSDARFVDVIHTDGGLLGNPQPLGHVDFYPNGGRGIQPGCARQEIANNRWMRFAIIVGCSHQRAWEYFKESILMPKAFPAFNCKPTQIFNVCRQTNGTAYMGMPADSKLRGKFYLQTNDAPPFGKFKLSKKKQMKSNRDDYDREMESHGRTIRLALMPPMPIKTVTQQTLRSRQK